MLVLTHGQCKAQIVPGVFIGGVQPQGFLISAYGTFGVLTTQKQIAHVVPSVGFDDRVFRQRRGTLKSFHGLFITAIACQGQPPVQGKLSRRSAFPAFSVAKQTVGSSKVSVKHGLGSFDGIVFGALSKRRALSVDRWGEGEQQGQGSKSGFSACRRQWPKPFNQQEHEPDKEEPMELVHVIGIGHFRRLSGIQIFDAFKEWTEVHIPGLSANISSCSSFDHRYKHALIQGRHYRLSIAVFLVACLSSVPVKLRNGAACFAGHTCSVDLDS